MEMDWKLVWGVLLAGVGGIIWLIRLEAKVIAMREVIHGENGIMKQIHAMNESVKSMNDTLIRIETSFGYLLKEHQERRDSCGKDH